MKDLFDIPQTAYKVSPERKEKRELKNGSQNAIIYSLFEKHPKAKLTAWDVQRLLRWPERRITSIRRAITTLKDSEHLVKLDETKIEFEGEPNHYYQIA